MRKLACKLWPEAQTGLLSGSYPAEVIFSQAGCTIIRYFYTSEYLMKKTTLKNIRTTLDMYQHSRLNIRVSSHLQRPTLPEADQKRYSSPHRKDYYFILMMLSSQSKHLVDLNELTVKAGELLFVVPSQIHTVPVSLQGTEYYKLAFDASCLASVPMHFSFLVNPLQQQILRPGDEAQKRIAQLFAALSAVLSERTASTTVVVSYLNALLAELDFCYFNHDTKSRQTPDQLPQLIRFRILLEEEFLRRPEVKYIAAKMAMSASSLYNLIKSKTGKSPKELFTDRLMLEAQRRLYYEELSVKELSAALGFEDADYFSRLFKKTTGQTITQFISKSAKHRQ